MCVICDGAKSTSEMPCSKALTRYGQFLQKVMGEGPASAMVTQVTGGPFAPTEQAREVIVALCTASTVAALGIYKGSKNDTDATNGLP